MRAWVFLNWPLAIWQLKELKKLLKICTITRPKYTDDINTYISDDLDPLMSAIEAHDMEQVKPHFAEAVDTANDFHRRWNKPWIVWKLPGTPPPDLELKPKGP